MKKLKVLIQGAMLMLMLLSSCQTGNVSPYQKQYSQDAYWYGGLPQATNDLADVFYILPTCVEDWKDEQGVTHYLADPLNEEQRQRMEPSFSLAQRIFADSANFYAPYYHQATLGVWTRESDFLKEKTDSAMTDIESAFDYYLEHHNNGKPFILAGFSQGGMGVIRLLKHMDDETYKRLVAAYAIGWSIQSEDLEISPKDHVAHVLPARGAKDTGVTINYNTVMDPQSYPGGSLEKSLLKSAVEGNLHCINPLNWTTTEEPATLQDTATVRLDAQNQILLVSGLDWQKYFVPRLEAVFPKGNLHLQELTFYEDALRENVKLRIRSKAEN